MTTLAGLGKSVRIAIIVRVGVCRTEQVSDREKVDVAIGSC